MRWIAILAWGLWSVAALANEPLPASVTDALRQAKIPMDAVGVYVQAVDQAKPRIAVQADRLFNPASTLKLVTTFAALDLLGPAHTWKTTVYATEPVKGGVLNGDLYIKGGGDPNFLLDDLWKMLRALRLSGLKEIRGKLVLDRSVFAPASCDPGAFDNAPFKPHNTCPDALLLNFNAVKLSFVPEETGKKIAVQADPKPLGMQVVNRVQAIDGACTGALRDRLRWDAYDWVHGNAAQPPADRRFFVKGDYPSTCGPNALYVPVLSAPLFFYGVMEQLWKEMGGSLRGGWREDVVPQGAYLLTEHESVPLAQIVRDINKYSNNVMARQLLLLLAIGSPLGAADTQTAQQVVRNWAQARGLPLPGLVLDNGSGLARSARLTPAGLGQLLVAAFRSPVMPEFMASLPVAGVDGTLRRQLQGSAIQGQAHMKTGSLRDVRAMAGYVLSLSGKRYAVVVLVNHEQADIARAVFDELLAWVVSEG